MSEVIKNTNMGWGNGNFKKMIASTLCSTMLFASNSIFVPNSTFAAENTITGTGFNVVDSERSISLCEWLCICIFS